MQTPNSMDDPESLSKEVHCLNCGTPLDVSAKFCSDCGQKVRPLKITLRELLEDAWDATFGFDSKLFKSGWRLFSRPGYLTAQYLEGKRVAYLRPVTLFLLVAGVFFVCLEWFGSAQSTTKFVVKGKEYSSVTILPGFDLIFTSDKIEAIKAAKDEEIPDLIREMGIELPSWEAALISKSMHIIREDGMEELRHRFYAIGSKSILLLIPLMALVVKLLHFRRRIYFLDAVVYCMHLHSVLFCAFLLLVLFPADSLRDNLAILLAPFLMWYTVQSMVVAFQNSYGMAILKASTLLFAQALLVLLLTVMLIFISVAVF